jgi:hypothetical protein
MQWEVATAPCGLAKLKKKKRKEKKKKGNNGDSDGDLQGMVRIFVFLLPYGEVRYKLCPEQADPG